MVDSVMNILSAQIKPNGGSQHRTVKTKTASPTMIIPIVLIVHIQDIKVYIWGAKESAKQVFS